MRSWLVVLIALVGTAKAGIAAGQVIEVPSFEVARPTIENYVGALDVAAAPDGTLLFLYSEYGSGRLNTTTALTPAERPVGCHAAGTGSSTAASTAMTATLPVATDARRDASWRPD